MYGSVRGAPRKRASLPQMLTTFIKQMTWPHIVVKPAEHYKVKSAACFRCPVACTQVCEVKEGDYKGMHERGFNTKSIALSQRKQRKQALKQKNSLDSRAVSG